MVPYGRSLTLLTDLYQLTQEPLLRVSRPMVPCMLLETPLLTLILQARAA
jgi:nicotinic acid phosphoribosyltransferase